MDIVQVLAPLIQAAIAGDRPTVRRLAGQLSRQLQRDGEATLADKIRRAAQTSDAATGYSLQRKPSLRTMEQAGVVPSDRETNLTLANWNVPPFEDPPLVLTPSLQSEVQEFLEFVRNQEALRLAGVGSNLSMLIYGPPGCGKSLLARHVAEELELPLLTARCDTLVSSYLGSTSKNIRQLFEFASEKSCVLFLDEFDALAKARDDKYELGELKRVVVSLLQNIDLLGSDTVLIAATNHEQLLDTAVWRRFAHRICLSLPGTQEREALIRNFLGQYEPDIKTSSALASISEGLSGALIQDACVDEIRKTILSNKDRIDPSSLLRRLYRQNGQKPSTDDEWLEAEANRLRRVDPKLFTVRCLAHLFGYSVGKMSAILKAA